MCDQCDCNPVKYGEVMPGWTLARASSGSTHWKAGEWALCFLDSDADVVWEDPCPNVDTFFDMSDDEIDGVPNGEFNANMKVIDSVLEWGKHLRYVDGLRSAGLVMAACVANGWDVELHGSPETWLAQQVAKCIAASELTTMKEVIT